MIKITMDGGNTEIAVHAKRTKLLGFKGIRKMLEGFQISVTLDDRKMAVRNLVGEDLIMCGGRHNRPSMIKQDGTREAIGLERFMEICGKGIVSVGLKEGKRMRGYIIEGRALEEAVPEIVSWVVEGYLYGEERKETQTGYGVKIGTWNGVVVEEGACTYMRGPRMEYTIWSKKRW